MAFKLNTSYAYAAAIGSLLLSLSANATQAIDVGEVSDINSEDNIIEGIESLETAQEEALNNTFFVDYTFSALMFKDLYDPSLSIKDDDITKKDGHFERGHFNLGVSYLRDNLTKVGDIGIGVMVSAGIESPSSVTINTAKLKELLGNNYDYNKMLNETALNTIATELKDANSKKKYYELATKEVEEKKQVLVKEERAKEAGELATSLINKIKENQNTKNLIMNNSVVNSIDGAIGDYEFHRRLQSSNIQNLVTRIQSDITTKGYSQSRALLENIDSFEDGMLGIVRDVYVFKQLEAFKQFQNDLRGRQDTQSNTPISEIVKNQADLEKEIVNFFKTVYGIDELRAQEKANKTLNNILNLRLDSTVRTILNSSSNDELVKIFNNLKNEDFKSTNTENTTKEITNKKTVEYQKLKRAEVLEALKNTIQDAPTHTHIQLGYLFKAMVGPTLKFNDYLSIYAQVGASLQKISTSKRVLNFKDDDLSKFEADINKLISEHSNNGEAELSKDFDKKVQEHFSRFSTISHWNASLAWATGVIVRPMPNIAFKVGVNSHTISLSKVQFTVGVGASW